jgi:inorganic pyrophosphatase
MFQAHPWHGVSAGDKSPEVVTSFIEIVPTDTVKYEVDKPSGLLRIDRPQRYSSICPTLYGFIPQTYCGQTVADRAMERLNAKGIAGDGDPMDICVLTENRIPKGNFLLKARPIGGLRMIDSNEADDKIIAVHDDDAVYGKVTELWSLPPTIVERLQHYFLTYKQLPGSSPRKVQIAEIYDREEAYEVIRRSQADYQAKYGTNEDRMKALRRAIMGE